MIGLVGSTGGLAASYRYDPYGETIASTGTVDNSWLFAGQYRDKTGLYKMGERYYDPVTGRCTQQDPSTSMTMYARLTATHTH